MDANTANKIIATIDRFNEVVEEVNRHAPENTNFVTKNKDFVELTNLVKLFKTLETKLPKNKDLFISLQLQGKECLENYATQTLENIQSEAEIMNHFHSLD